MNDHLDEQQLRQVIGNGLDETDSDELFLTHLDRCAQCQLRMDAIAGEPTEWLELAERLHGWSSELSSGRDRLSTDALTRELAFPLHIDPAGTQKLAAQLLEPPSHPEMLGRIGRYEVERLIGTGGMGVVFKAFDTELNRPVAIKILTPILAGNSTARHRFAREARAAAAVVHEHVVPIHNVEASGPTPFLVMQFVAGESLQSRIDRQGPLQLAEILRIGFQIASGLSAAHQQGLVHRDIKPSNILLEETLERALISDFGLARGADDATLTQFGCPLGTPQYMSPEQAAGRHVDARSDLFSLGSVLFTMCTGKPPFRGDSSLAVMRQIIDDALPEISTANPNIPSWLRRLISKLLSKCPADRFQNAGQVAELLQNCLAHVQQPQSVPLPKELEQVDSLEAKGQRDRSSRGFRLWPFLMAAFAGCVWLGIVIILEWNKGQLRIESELQGVHVHVSQQDKVVEDLQVDSSSKSVRISAGAYKIELMGSNNDHQLSDPQVTIQPGKTTVVQIKQKVRTKDDPDIVHLPARISHAHSQPAAIALIIHPDTMRDGQTISRDLATKVLRGLMERDYFGAIVYNERGNVWYRDRALEVVGNSTQHQQKLDELGQLWAGDMPDLDYPIRMALEELQKTEAARKHILVLTSGTMAQTNPDTLALLQEDKVTLSGIQLDYLGIGVSEPLHKLASGSGGRFAFLLPRQIAVLGSVLADELESLCTSDLDKLTRIGQAMHQFSQKSRQFPGSANRLMRATKGHPFSWRVALLPYLGHQALFDAYHFDEPWDSAKNKALLTRLPQVYRSLNSDDADKQNGLTHFQGIASTEGGLGAGSGEDLDSFTNGLSKTILILESDSAVPWTKPEDLSGIDDQVLPLGGDDWQVLFADGSVGEIPVSERARLQSLILRQ